MSDPITAIYKAAKKDKEFRPVYEACDGKFPFFPDRTDEMMAACSYSGWLMHNYGATVTLEIYASIKAGTYISAKRI